MYVYRTLANLTLLRYKPSACVQYVTQNQNISYVKVSSLLRVADKNTSTDKFITPIRRCEIFHG